MARMDTDTTRRVTYVGPALPARDLVQLLREHGAEVRVVPVRLPSASGEVVRDVAVEMVATGAVAAILLAVHTFRQRFPHTTVEVEGHDDEDVQGG